MEPVSSKDENYPKPNYLPHHVIFNDLLLKFRVVFNGSFLTSSGVSLNDILHPGQKLQPDIWLIISRWRFWKFVFTADIVKMFRQIRIVSSNCNLQRIVWRPDPSQPFQEYNLTTVTYGTRPAPFLAIRVRQQLANDEREQFPLGAEVLLQNTYVDDIYPGANSLQHAIEIRDDLVNILASCGVTLSKWAANDNALLPDNSNEKIKSDKAFDFENSVSTLGLRWNQTSDDFHFEITPILLSNPTKRMVASEIAKLFDPLGWLSPFLLTAKILLQDCWLAGINWDATLPETLQIKWSDFQKQFNQLGMIKIPRYIQTNDDQSNWELHGFADAFERAYSAVLFLVDRSTDVAHSHLLISKTKLAPVKAISLPKLELCAAHLLSKLVAIIIEKLLTSIQLIYYWSDSQIVLSWLQEYNPADCATRGFTVQELHESSLWWHGPEWLIEDPELQDPDLLERVSSLSKLVRVTAYCFRFVRKLRDRTVDLPTYLTSDDLKESLNAWIVLVQNEHFSQVRNTLEAGRRLPSKHLMLKLTLFLDQNSILRVTGRLENSFLSYDEKHPIILPKNSRFSKLIVLKAHSECLHGGQQLTLSRVLQKFWIISEKTFINKIVRDCVKCARFRTVTPTQLMGQLPVERITVSKPFTFTGLDYAGPIRVLPSKSRGIKSTKGYLCLFVCLSTRAIHLELVSDLETKTFLGAFNRFTSRRGQCIKVFSDNARTFVGAERELKALFSGAKSIFPRVAEVLATQGTTCSFIPPHSPHFGGIWEAGV
ncbi:uncharacterized protein LOC122513072 [Leptopilina heterotoma]|uniref:uncharacterized protein LOC122513072 n=1 Tax=Leptopilina heterotoma TaxID=63436 RepID=UPI001CA93078|nr:uncharacterized protein LOC122513072 [Leptopilina heterotoma]